MRARMEHNNHEPLMTGNGGKSGRQNKDYGTHRRFSTHLKDVIPDPLWVRARFDSTKRRFPQTIAHRGYKAKFPENTMAAFRGAVEVGTHALETDVHLSRDGVVVLSHDPDLKRCFGDERKIVDCDWEDLCKLRTLREPHESMPRLKDLLEYMAQPEQDHLWVLLDIKVDNDAEKVMRLIADTLASVPTASRSWKERVVLGIWVARFLPLCLTYLPEYPISLISFSTTYSRQFLKVPNVSFNMFQRGMLGPAGSRFMRDLKRGQRPTFLWTVNEVNLMKWGIQKEVDGVITDDPKMFNELCDHWRNDLPPARPTWAQWLYTFWLYVLFMVLGLKFRRMFPETIDSFLKDGRLKAKASLALEA